MDRSSSYSRTGLHVSSSSHRGCWYYLKYFFLFVSLIQFLIIMGLVLFMIYGNAHAGTEAHLQVTEKRADSLSGQLLSLTALNANLSKELSITNRSRDAIMQLLVVSRREVDRINSSYRQCHAEQIQNWNNMKYVAIIMKNEELCQQNLKDIMKNYTDKVHVLEEKVKSTQKEQENLKIACNKDKDALLAANAEIEAQMKKCNVDKMRNFDSYQLTINELKLVRGLCAELDKQQLSEKLEKVWKESLIARSLSSMSYSIYTPEIEIVRHCRDLPRIFVEKFDSLSRELKLGIEKVAQENTELHRQVENNKRNLETCEDEKLKVTKESQQKLQKIQQDHIKQYQVALDEKATLQKEKEALLKELEQKKQELILVKGQLDINRATLDTCIKTKAQGPSTIPRPPGPPVNTVQIDPDGLEEFKRKVLEFYQKVNMSPGNSASG